MTQRGKGERVPACLLKPGHVIDGVIRRVVDHVERSEDGRITFVYWRGGGYHPVDPRTSYWPIGVASEQQRQEEAGGA